LNMEASEIVRRNEAISRFMGLTRPPTYDGPNSVGRGYYDPNELEYHSEWSWIMPAVEKIIDEVGVSCQMKRDLFDEQIGGEFMFTMEADHYSSYAFPSFKGFGKKAIDAVWLAVSDYCLSLETKVC